MAYDIGTLIDMGLQGLFFVLLGAFVIHALLVTYHWFSYGANKAISLLALAVYLGGGAILLLTMSLSLTL